MNVEREKLLELELALRRLADNIERYPDFLHDWTERPEDEGES